MHTEDDSEMHKTKAKTIGKMIDQNLNLEGIVYHRTQSHADRGWIQIHHER